MKHLVLVLLTSVQGFAQSSSKLIIDLPKIAGKSKNEVIKVLGRPEKSEPMQEGDRPGTSYFFNHGQVEVDFINGHAEWITVNNLSWLNFEPQSLSQFGLNPDAPSWSNAHVLEWKKVKGIRSIKLFPGINGKCDYAFIAYSLEP